MEEVHASARGDVICRLAHRSSIRKGRTLGLVHVIGLRDWSRVLGLGHVIGLFDWSRVGQEKRKNKGRDSVHGDEARIAGTKCRPWVCDECEVLGTCSYL